MANRQNQAVKERARELTRDISTFSVRNQLQLIATVYQMVSRDSEAAELEPLKRRMYELLAVQYPEVNANGSLADEAPEHAPESDPALD